MAHAFSKNIARIFLGLYVLAVFKPLFPYLEYALNKRMIVQELCENRTKPELQCEGRCYLIKRLAKAEDAQTASPRARSLKVAYEYDSSHLRLGEITIPPLTSLNQFLRNSETSSSHSKFEAEIFHPPRS